MTTLIAILIFAAWLAFAWWKPRMAFSYLPFALPFYLVRLKIGPLPTTGLEMVVLATIAAWLFRAQSTPRVHSGQAPHRAQSKNILTETWASFRPWAIPCGLWLVAGAISVIVPADHVAALGLYRAYFIEPVLLFFIGIDLMRPDALTPSRPHALFRNLAIVTIIFGLWAIFQYATGIGLPAEYAPLAVRRSVGPFPYPNALSLFVAPIVALAFAGIVTSHESRVTSSRDDSSISIPAWLGWTTVIAGIIAILLAKSDGGLIAVIAAMGVALILNKRTRIVTITIAVIGAIAISAIPSVRTPVLDQLLFREWSGKVRVIMWKETVTMLKDRPVFGAGLAAYPATIKPYHKATWMEIFQYPHDILLNLWSETGVLGVIAFGWILVAWAQSTEHRAQGLRISLPVITAILVHGLVDVPYFKNDLAIVFWLLILITAFNNNEAMKQWSNSAT
jgi:hypothetical protein